MRSRSISLTSLIDVVLAGPHEKVGRVADVRQLYRDSAELGFAPDFYGPFREAAIAAIRTGDPGLLTDFLTRYEGDRWRYRSFVACVRGLTDWLRKHDTIFIRTPRVTHHNSNGLTVRVNPEVWVEVDGTPLVLKMYLKEPPATKAKLAAPLHLLALATATWRGAAVAGVLDVRGGRVHRAVRLPRRAPVMLASDIESFARIWDMLDASEAA